MTPPTASVVICVYNRPDQVVRCLASLLALTFQGFEIVVVDDGSTDSTPRQLEAYRRAHPEAALTVVRNPVNLGVSGARNAGIAAARGEFVAFTDSDCTVEPGWLGALLAGFADPEVAAVGGAVEDAPPRTWAERAYVGSCRIGQGSLQGRALVGNNMAFRRAIVARHGFDPALSYYCDDDDLARRLAAMGHRTAFAPGAVVHHHHRMTLGQLLRQARRQGQGSARYWYKHGMVLGRDLLPLAAALATSPLALLGLPWALIPISFLALQVAALAFAEVAFKGKSWTEALFVLPVVTAHSLIKAASVAWTFLRLALGGEAAIRESRRGWLARRREIRGA